MLSPEERQLLRADWHSKANLKGRYRELKVRKFGSKGRYVAYVQLCGSKYSPLVLRVVLVGDKEGFIAGIFDPTHLTKPMVAVKFGDEVREIILSSCVPVLDEKRNLIMAHHEKGTARTYLLGEAAKLFNGNGPAIRLDESNSQGDDKMEDDVEPSLTRVQKRQLAQKKIEEDKLRKEMERKEKDKVAKERKNKEKEIKEKKAMKTRKEKEKEEKEREEEEREEEEKEEKEREEKANGGVVLDQRDASCHGTGLCIFSPQFFVTSPLSRRTGARSWPRNEPAHSPRAERDAMKDTGRKKEEEDAGEYFDTMDLDITPITEAKSPKTGEQRRTAGMKKGADAEEMWCHHQSFTLHRS